MKHEERLLDYVCLVGVPRAGSVSTSGASLTGPGQGQSTSPSKSVLSPQLLRRFPSSDHDDFKLPTNVTSFCQPEGCITFSARNKGAKAAGSKGNHSYPDLDTQAGYQATRKDTNTFVFTLTDKDSNTTSFGICHNFYRIVEGTAGSHGKAATWSLPKKCSPNTNGRDDTSIAKGAFAEDGNNCFKTIR